MCQELASCEFPDTFPRTRYIQNIYPNLTAKVGEEILVPHPCLYEDQQQPLLAAAILQLCLSFGTSETHTWAFSSSSNVHTCMRTERNCSVPLPMVFSWGQIQFFFSCFILNSSPSLARQALCSLQGKAQHGLSAQPWPEVHSTEKGRPLGHSALRCTSVAFQHVHAFPEFFQKFLVICL